MSYLLIPDIMVGAGAEASAQSHTNGGLAVELVIVLVISIVLNVATLAHGADGAQVAAALKDEASECRYLLSLCGQNRKAHQMAERGVKATKANPVNSAAWEKGYVELRAGTELSKETLDELLAAARVIRAKHETRPACFAECKDIIDLEHFE